MTYDNVELIKSSNYDWYTSVVNNKEGTFETKIDIGDYKGDKVYVKGIVDVYFKREGLVEEYKRNYLTLSAKEKDHTTLYELIIGGGIIFIVGIGIGIHCLNKSKKDNVEIKDISSGLLNENM